MTVEYRTGDLFEQRFRAMGHGVNCAGVMGSGIALQFKIRWSDMYHAYSAQCQVKLLQPGEVFPWASPGGITIYNMATQRWPGPHAQYLYIAQSLDKALQLAEAQEIDTVGIPRIGAGLGGLPWEKVSQTIEATAARHEVTVVVVSLPT